MMKSIIVLCCLVATVFCQSYDPYPAYDNWSGGLGSWGRNTWDRWGSDPWASTRGGRWGWNRWGSGRRDWRGRRWNRSSVLSRGY